jgi:hypothetical protein
VLEVIEMYEVSVSHERSNDRAVIDALYNAMSSSAAKKDSCNGLRFNDDINGNGHDTVHYRFHKEEDAIVFRKEILGIDLVVEAELKQVSKTQN